MIKYIFYFPFLLFAAPSYYITWNQDPTTTAIISWLEKETQHTIAINQVEISDIERIAFEDDYTLARVKLQGLAPSTRYDVAFNHESSKDYFVTLSDKPPLKFAAGGDVYYHNGETYKHMCQTVAQFDPAFVVLGGDIAYTIKKGLPVGSSKWEMHRWQTFFDIWSSEMQTKTHRKIPLVVAVGNHDISRHLGDDSERFVISKLFAFDITYRSLQIGNYALLLLLDTHHFSPIEGAQTAWLKSQLQKHKDTPFISAHYHIAAYPSYGSYTAPRSEKIRKYWVPLFQDHHINAAFEHHNHTYKRTYPLLNNKPDPNGIVYLGDGSWGIIPRPIHPAPYLAHALSINAFFLIDIQDASHQITAYDLQGHLIEKIAN